MVLIALAIVFAGLGAMSLSSSDAETTDASGSDTNTATALPSATSTVVQTTTEETTASTTTTTSPTTTTAAASHDLPVRVLNNSLVVGLASRTANQLTDSGWTIAGVGNFTGENVAKTTVFYGSTPGEHEAATEIAEELGATAVARSTGAGDSGSGVTVVVTGN